MFFMLYSFEKMLKNIPFFHGISFYGKINNSRKYQVVLQQSEEDCGAACLASIAKFTDRIFQLAVCENWSVRASKGRLYSA